MTQIGKLADTINGFRQRRKRKAHGTPSKTGSAADDDMRERIESLPRQAFYVKPDQVPKIKIDAREVPRSGAGCA